MSDGMKFQKVPIDKDGRMATVAEVRANHEKVMGLLDEWTIALLDGGKIDGRGHGGKVQDGNFKEQCGEKIIVIQDGREKRATDQWPQELTFQKVPIDRDGRMATVAEVRANHQKVMSLLDEWTIALLDGGKVDGRGHGGKIQEGDFQEQCGEKIIVEGSNDIREMEATVQVKATSQASPGYNATDLKFEKVPIDRDGQMATVSEVRANHQKVMDLLDEWTIALLDGGKVDGRGHGGNVQDGNFKEQCGEKIIVTQGGREKSATNQRPQELKFQKVPIDRDGRMATVAEVRANHQKVMSLLDEWTIALLDGGKVDGRGHGGKIQEGDFKDQCGEKIIVEGSDGIREMLATVQVKATSQAALVPIGEPDYMAVEAGKDGNITVPDGWSIVGVMDPALQTVMKRFIQDRQDVDNFNNGTMVIITDTRETRPEEEWIIVEKKNGGIDAPAGFEIVEVDESTLGNTCQKFGMHGSDAFYNLYCKVSNGDVKFAKRNGSRREKRETDRGPEELKFEKVPFDAEGRMATVSEVKANQETVRSLLDKWTIALLDGGKIDGPGHGWEIHVGDFKEQCGEKIIVVESNNIEEMKATVQVKPTSQVTPGDHVAKKRFQKVPISNDGRMATVAEVKANQWKVMDLLDTWTIALLDGGKVDGRGHGGKVQDGEFKEQCGEKIIVIEDTRGESFTGEPDYMAVYAGKDGKIAVPDGWSIVGVMDPALQTVMGRFMQGPQDVDDFNSGKMVIVTNKPEISPKEEWIIVEKKDGGFHAPTGFKIVEMDESNFGEYMPKVQHLLNQTIAGEIENGTVKFAKKVGSEGNELKFQKVHIVGNGRMATVAEVRANHQKVMDLLDEWTIALLDGGKVDGRGHGGKVQDGDFKDQCGEKIIVI